MGVKKEKVVRAKSKKKASRYQCGVCGMVVAVDEMCGCVAAHPVVCCGTKMKKK